MNLRAQYEVHVQRYGYDMLLFLLRFLFVWSNYCDVALGRTQYKTQF